MTAESLQRSDDAALVREAADLLYPTPDPRAEPWPEPEPLGQMRSQLRTLADWLDGPMTTEPNPEHPNHRKDPPMTTITTPTRTLTQIDGWLDIQPGEDCYIVPDVDGDCMMVGQSVEAFRTEFAVRVFVEPGTDPVAVARLLRKAAGWVERDGCLLPLDRAEWVDDPPEF